MNLTNHSYCAVEYVNQLITDPDRRLVTSKLSFALYLTKNNVLYDNNHDAFNIFIYLTSLLVSFFLFSCLRKNIIFKIKYLKENQNV